MTANSYQDRIDAIRELLALFRLERTVYLVITIFSLFILLTCAVVLMFRNTVGTPELIGLFGSSGGITYSTGRLLKMWSEAINVLQPGNSRSD